MNNYIFITASHCGNSVSVSRIVAKDKIDAISKAFEYYGGNCLLAEEFRLVCEGSEDYRMYRLFSNFTGENILYFGLQTNEYFIDNLNVIE